MGKTKLSTNVADIINEGQKIKVDISKIIVPDYHDRTDVDDETIESLANSMSEVGQLNPILVEKKSDSVYELISGLRRFEAALKLNWANINAIVFEDLEESSRLLIMIAENAQRQDINDFDLVNSLIHFLGVSIGITDDDVKSFLFKLKNLDSGNIKSISFEEKKMKRNMETILERTDKYTLNFVINKLKVLNFFPAIIKAMKEHKLLYTYGIMLNKIKDDKVMNDLLNKFISKQITKDELKKEIKKFTGNDISNPVIPFNDTLKKLREYSKFSEEKQKAITAKMQEIESLIAS